MTPGAKVSAGDLGKRTDKTYTFLYGRLPGPENRFLVNPRTEERMDAHFTFCFAGGVLTGAALVGDLSPMLGVQEAVDGHWAEETLRNYTQKRGVKLYGE